MMVLSAGIITSHPSKPNLFSEDHLRARKSSNLHQRKKKKEKQKKQEIVFALQKCRKYLLLKSFSK